SFKRIVNTPGRGIGATSVQRLEDFAATYRHSIWEVATNPALRDQLQARTSRALKSFTDLIDSLRRSAKEMPVSDLVREVMEKTGYLKELEDERTMESRGRIENLEELVSVATMFDTQAED